MAKPKFTKDTSEWSLIKRRLRKDKQSISDVGFFGKRYGVENNNLPVAYIAQINNEGISVPPRPFMYKSISDVKKSKHYKELVVRCIRDIADGRMDRKEANTMLGNYLKAVIEQNIEEWANPSNSPKTILLKGRNDPLIDTGTMLGSVEVKTKKTGRNSK